MIIGIGTDLTDIARIEKMLDEKFIKRCFTQGEQDYAERKRPGGTHIGAYARRFAAKEACAKALGTGIGGQAALTEIEVIHDEAGKPGIKLSGTALERLKKLTPDGRKAAIHLSLTDEAAFALAFVVIEAK